MELSHLALTLLAAKGPGGGNPVINPAPQVPPGMAGPVGTIVGWGKWFVLVCGVVGLLICSGQMMIGRRNRSTFAADGAAGIPWVLGGLSLAATAAAIVGMFVR